MHVQSTDERRQASVQRRRGGVMPRGPHRGGRQRRKRGLGAQAQAVPGACAAGATRALRRARVTDRRGEQRLEAVQRVVRAHLAADGHGYLLLRSWQPQPSRDGGTAGAGRPGSDMVP